MSNKILNTKGSQHIRLEDFNKKKLTSLGGLPVCIETITAIETNLGTYNEETIRIVISSNDPIHTVLNGILSALGGEAANTLDINNFKKIDSNSYSFITNDTDNILTTTVNTNTTVVSSGTKGLELTDQTPSPASFKEYNNFFIPVNLTDIVITWTIKLPTTNIDNFIKWGVADLEHDFSTPDLATYFQYNNGTITTHYMGEGSKALGSFEYDTVLDGTGPTGINLITNKIYTFFIRYQSDKSLFHFGIMDEQFKYFLVDKRGGSIEPTIGPATLALRLRPFFEVSTNGIAWTANSIQLLNTSIYCHNTLCDNICGNLGRIKTYSLVSEVSITGVTERNILACYYSSDKDGESGIRKIILKKLILIIDCPSDYEINIYYNNDIDTEITSAETGVDSVSPGNDYIDICSLRFREIPVLGGPNNSIKIYSEMSDTNILVLDLEQILFKYFGIDFSNIANKRSGLIISFKSFVTGSRVITNSKLCWNEF